MLMIEGYPASHFSGSYADLFTGVLGLNSVSANFISTVF
jgi:hypothetical protein